MKDLRLKRVYSETRTLNDDCADDDMPLWYIIIEIVAHYQPDLALLVVDCTRRMDTDQPSRYLESAYERYTTTIYKESEAIRRAISIADEWLDQARIALETEQRRVAEAGMMTLPFAHR